MSNGSFSSRCSLATKDLNRQWSSPNPTLFPTIYHMKGLIAYISTCTSQPITVGYPTTIARDVRSPVDIRLQLFCDFHGHSRQKNFFFYGNDPRQHYLGPIADRPAITKLFPKLFTGVPGFALQSCLFTMRKQKEGCARMVVWDEFKIDLAYTMEATYSGFDSGIYKVRAQTRMRGDHRQPSEHSRACRYRSPRCKSSVTISVRCS